MVATQERTQNHRMAKAKEKTRDNGKPSAASLIEQNGTLKTTLQQIEKQFGEGSIMPLGGDRTLSISGIPTGSLSLDVALGGQGIPRGRIIEIFAPESSGKPTLARHVPAPAQKAGGAAATSEGGPAIRPT